MVDLNTTPEQPTYDNKYRNPKVPQPPSDKKTWWKSKTIWLNAITAGLAAAQMSGYFLQPFMQPQDYAFAMFGLAIINGILRVVTTKGLGR